MIPPFQINFFRDSYSIVGFFCLFCFFIFFLANFWLCWVFVAVQVFSSCGEWGLLSSCSGSSCSRAQALGAWPSVVATHGLSGCGSWTLELGPSSGGVQA